MEIVGSIAPEEVPENARRAPRTGVWSSLARRCIADHEDGRVTVVKVADQDELAKLRNGTAEALRKAGYGRRFSVEALRDGLKVFMEIERVKPEPENLGKLRKRARA